VTLNCINVRMESSPHSAGVKRVSAAVARRRTGKASSAGVLGGVEEVTGKSFGIRAGLETRATQFRPLA
jgi:hypothetical protein